MNFREESNATPLSKEAAADGKKTRSLPSVNWREMELWPRSGFGEKRVKFWPRCEGEREGGCNILYIHYPIKNTRCEGEREGGSHSRSSLLV